MQTVLDITTPTEMYTDAPWPEGVPMPGRGDTVNYRGNDISWKFTVKERQIQVDLDAVGSPQGRVTLTVDSEPPMGFF